MQLTGKIVATNKKTWSRRKKSRISAIQSLETECQVSDDSTHLSQVSGHEIDEFSCEKKDKQDTILHQLPDKKLNQFIWTTSPQPHAVRRRLILAKHPEIEKLCGNDPFQAIPAILTICIQVYLAILMSEAAIPLFAYIASIIVVSATLNHSLFAAMHEGSHNTIFKSKVASDIFCIATTIPMGIPAAIPFKRYHLDHHVYQGVNGMDPDIPTEIEARLFSSKASKFLWIALMPAIYSLRPMITRPKKVLVLDIISWIIIMTTDLAVLYFGGIKSLLYLVLGTFFSMNFHPFSGHFISEHFIMPGTDMYQETSSYYGWSNLLTYNVGYHNEHHDFPRVPGSSLPMIRKLAPEFYSMPHHPSWMMVTWNFILGNIITPYNRVKRTTAKGGQLPVSLLQYKLHDNDIPFGGEAYFWPRLSD